MRKLRQRTVRPGLLGDDRVSGLSMAARYFLLALMFYADDAGRGEVLPRQMRRVMFPRDEVSPERIEETMLVLDEAEVVLVYSDEDGRTLFQIAPDLLGTVDRRGGSEYPPPARRSHFASVLANRDANRGYGEGGGRESGVGFEGDEGDEPEEVPPEPFCERHPGGSGGKNCRACGDKRMANDQWKRLKRAGRDASHLEGGGDDDGWEETF